MPYGRGVMAEAEAREKILDAMKKYRNENPNFPWVVVEMLLFRYLTWDDDHIAESVILFQDIAEDWRGLLLEVLVKNLNNPGDALRLIPLLFGDDSQMNAIVTKTNDIAGKIQPVMKFSLQSRTGGMGSG